jgi:thiopeptide-type bacteriocin biosynthesis protein
VQDEILADRLPALIDALGDSVDGWYFVRDDGPGLVVRLRGTRPGGPTALLAVAGAWTDNLGRRGLAGDCSLVPAGRQGARRGEPAAAPDAEAVFQADSEAAVTRLRLARRGALLPDPHLVTALGLVTVVRAARPADWADWLQERVPHAPHREAFRSRRLELRELTGCDARALADRCGGPELASAWGSLQSALARWAKAAHSTGGTPEKRPDEAAGQTAEEGPRSSVDDGLMALLRAHLHRAPGIDEISEGAAFALARGFAELTVNAVRYGDG